MELLNNIYAKEKDFLEENSLEKEFLNSKI